MIPNKFIILWDNFPIGLDSNSGGYPYKTSDPNSVKYWPTFKEVDSYLNVITSHGKSRNYNLIEIREIQFRLMPMRKYK